MRIYIVICALFVTGITDCLADSVKDRLSRLEQKLSSKAYLEVWQSVEQLRNELRELRGEIEQQSHQLQQLQDQQKLLYSDMEQRIVSLEQASPRLKASENKETSEESLTEPEAGVDQQKNDNQTDSVSNQSIPIMAQKEIQGNYEKALQTLREGHYEEASVIFEQIATQHPGSELADNALYWLAETRYLDRKFKAADEIFEKIIVNYPESPKVPDAYLKRAYIQFEINRVNTGKRQLQSIIDKFPDSSAAKIAKKRLEKPR
ncbi:MAG: tol-pal system protein YbgF [Gammaproteobacteria bacterium]|nr:tol-pal system protein YbgF [Gammaproteobacteria bacterium]